MSRRRARPAPYPHDRNPLDADALLTAIPGLLGFIPERSLILLALDTSGIVHATIRHDLELDDAGAITPLQLDVLAGLGRIIRGYGSRSVLLVVADDRYPPDDERYRQVVAAAHTRLRPAGGVRLGYVVGGTYDAGSPWWLIWDARTGRSGHATVPKPGGVTGDPMTSPTAVAEAVTTGRRVLRRRSDMVAMLAPTAHCDGPCTAGAPEWATGTARAPESDAELLQVLIDEVRAPSAAHTCRRVELLHRAITRIPVRDAALALSVTDLRCAAEDLWRDLTCRLTGQGRASAATLLAHLHYIGGEGAYAGVALDCALAAASDWTLAALLDQALRGGVPPVELRPMIADSYATARGLGVTLPGITLPAAG